MGAAGVPRVHLSGATILGGEGSTASLVVLERGVVISTSRVAQDWGIWALLGVRRGGGGGG